MFSVGSFDWKNIIGGGSLLNDLGRTRGGALKPPVSGLLSGDMGDGEQKADLLRFSNPLQLLQQGGLDLERSYFTEQSQQVDFSFSFQDEHVRNLTTGGLLDVRSQTLKMDFSFQSSMETVDSATGMEREEMFQFELHLEASSIRMQEGRGEVNKENILEFARKILKKINKLQAEGTEIDGMVMDKDDLRDFGAEEGGKLLKQISHLIDLMRSIDRFNGKRGPHERLGHGREKTEAYEEARHEELDLNFSLSARRVESIISVAEALPTEEISPEPPGVVATDVIGVTAL